MKKFEQNVVMAPFNEGLPPRERTRIAIELSDVMMKMATYIICHVIVEYEELLHHDERLSVAHGFLQRVTTTHMCNHKLTEEGLVYEVRGQRFQLHDEYKTMALTRTVYEHLAMFYFLYEHPRTAAERDVVWQSWQHDSMRNLVKLVNVEGGQRVETVSYSQAWRYLFRSRDMAQLYHHLSKHCHPVYDGLRQYQFQSVSDQGDDGIPLHLSSCCLASLCRMFLRQLPQGEEVIQQHFSQEEQQVYNGFISTFVKR
jgi:hypothetical protein